MRERSRRRERESEWERQRERTSEKDSARERERESERESAGWAAVYRMFQNVYRRLCLSPRPIWRAASERLFRRHRGKSMVFELSVDNTRSRGNLRRGFRGIWKNFANPLIKTLGRSRKSLGIARKTRKIRRLLFQEFVVDFIIAES